VADIAKSLRRFAQGERVELEVSALAHGGETIARRDGWVFFLRYAIPGERVLAEITQVGKSFHRADAIEILAPAPDRITPACEYFHAGGCGGCDFHHISLSRQRELKSQVITEQLQRVAKMTIEVPVEEVFLDGHSGARYRTRATIHIDSSGRAGFLKNRSHEVQPISDCVVVAEHLGIKNVLAKRYSGITELHIPDEVRTEKIQVRGKEYQFKVSSESFWQGHLKAAELLATRALEILHPRPGEHALDLYGGVGLFGKVLAAHGAEVEIIEASASAVRDGRFNLRDYPNAHYHEGAVEEEIQRIERADLVLLDPPRGGAEGEVLEKIAALTPRTICYISCDPASLARDAARLGERGYEIASASAYDLFPQTAHIECVFAFSRVIS
jgi:tRNA/tmRNA/rRNA uracil-C5-methylase (TrmA/RlmC/RlmD family)